MHAYSDQSDDNHKRGKAQDATNGQLLDARYADLPQGENGNRYDWNNGIRYKIMQKFG